jgi:hypothetical protein
MDQKKTCICDCGREYVPKPKYKDSRVKCTTCIRHTKSSEVKAKAVKYLGGKCVDCEFTGHPVAFDFDHKDPTQKEFKISGKYIFRWKELKKELDKCDLRCCRCHRIKHYLIDFPQSGSF